MRETITFLLVVICLLAAVSSYGFSGYVEILLLIAAMVSLARLVASTEGPPRQKKQEALK
jgi:hypothetical protein